MTRLSLFLNFHEDPNQVDPHHSYLQQPGSQAVSSKVSRKGNSVDGVGEGEQDSAPSVILCLTFKTRLRGLLHNEEEVAPC